MRRTGLAATLFTLAYFFPSAIFTCKYASACISSERQVPIKFRRGLKDPFQHLASLDDGPNCCTWGGITCDNKTRHVTKLDLHSPCSVCSAYYNFSENGLDARDYGCKNLSGQLNPDLVQLKHLRHLDLSLNTFDGIPIPGFLGCMEDLSYAGFSGMAPKTLGNLSTLQVLVISSIYQGLLSAVDLWWLSTTLSLKHKHREMNLSDWIHSMSCLVLRICMSDSNLENIDQLHPS